MDSLLKIATNPDPECSFRNYMEVYLALEVAASRSVYTQAAKQRDLQLFEEWLQKAQHTGNITRWRSRDTKMFLEQQSTIHRPATVNRRLATLKHFAKFCLRLGAFTGGDPTERITGLPYEAPRPRSLTKKQLQRMYDAAEVLGRNRRHPHAMPVRDRAILLVLAQTGMRSVSICTLDLSQVDGKYLRGVAGKGSKKQDYFLPQLARDALQAWLEMRGPNPGPLFWSFSKRRIDRSDVAQILMRIAEEANRGVDESERIRISPHVLRHTVA